MFHQLLPLQRQHRGHPLISLTEKELSLKHVFFFEQFKAEKYWWSPKYCAANELSKPGLVCFSFFFNQMYFSEATSISLPWSSCFSIIIIHQLLQSLLLSTGMHRCNQREFCLLGDQFEFCKLLDTCINHSQIKYLCWTPKSARSWEQGRISVVKQSPGEPQPRSHVKHLPL